MYFKNKKHRQAFEEGIKKANKKRQRNVVSFFVIKILYRLKFM